MQAMLLQALECSLERNGKKVSEFKCPKWLVIANGGGGQGAKKRRHAANQPNKQANI